MRVIRRDFWFRCRLSVVGWGLRVGFVVVIGAMVGCFPDYDPTSVNLDDTVGGLPPVIESIQGNSTLASADGVIYFRNALAIEGKRFGDNPSVALKGALGTPDFDVLEQQEQSDERIVVRLPSKLVPGQYTLVVSSNGTDTTQSVAFVKGDPGFDGVAILPNVYTWEQFSTISPDPSALILKTEANQEFASINALVDIATLASDQQAGELATLATAESDYAPITELPDPAGYLSFDNATKKYALVSELPVTTGAKLKKDVPDASSYVTKAYAQTQGIKLGELATSYYNKAEMEKFLPRNIDSLPPAMDSQIAEMVYAAVNKKACPAGTVPLRGGSPTCIDQHEARVTAEGDCSDSPGAIFGQQPGDYEALSPGGTYSGDGVKLVACSTGAGKPSAYLTWYQAMRICADSGGRLCTNDEWQVAAAGSPDAHKDPETNATICLVAGSGPESGESAECVANGGAFHMVGNVSEWTADWMAGGHDPPVGVLASVSKSWPDGTTASVQDVIGWAGAGRMDDKGEWYYGFPTPVVRGGSFSLSTSAGVFHIDTRRLSFATSAEVGFRCCRNR